MCVCVCVCVCVSVNRCKTDITYNHADLVHTLL